MKRRMLVGAGLIVVLLIGAAWCLPEVEPEPTTVTVFSNGSLWTYEVPGPTLWERVQDRCRQLAGWPPNPTVLTAPPPSFPLTDRHWPRSAFPPAPPPRFSDAESDVMTTGEK